MIYISSIDIKKYRMKKTTSSFSLEKSYCHPISVENYFLSPKMPVKDHTGAFRTTNTSFKPEKYLIDQVSK